MSIENPTGPNYNYYDNNNKDSKSKIVPYLIAACVLLMGTNIFQFVSNNKKTNQIATLQTDLNETDKLKEELEKQYNEANVILEDMKGTNTELNALIDKQKDELAAQKDKIAGLIGNKKDLANARAEMAKMKSLMNGYITEIDDLKKKNGILTEENKTLASEKTALIGDVTREKAAKEDVTSQKKALEEEKSKVEAEKKDFQTKASVLKFQGNASELRGIKVKSNGKQDFDNNPDHIHVLQVNFNPLDNAVVKSGNEMFYVALLNPAGEVVSPKLDTDPSSEKQVKYTFKKNAEYSNGSRVSFDLPLGSGNATSLTDFMGVKSKKELKKCSMIVYNKGYESGRIALSDDFVEKKFK